MKKSVCVLIAVLIFLTSWGCADANDDNSFPVSSDLSSEPSNSEESISETNEIENLIAEFSDLEEHTGAPEIVENLTVADARIIISGTCEIGSVVYLTVNGIITKTIASDEGTFIIETTVGKGDSPQPAFIYARTDGKAVSEPAATSIKYTCFNECPYQSIVRIGSDGWLFFTNTEPQYTNNETLSSNRKNRITSKITERTNMLEEHGIKLVYVLIPNPNEIYSEYMPQDVVKGTVCYREEIAEALSEGGAIVLDMGETIRSLKGGEFEIYHHTDSHWTEYAAYFAYKALCDQFVNDGFTGSAAREISEFGFINEYRAAGDLYYDLGLDEYALKVNSTFSYITFETPVNLPKYSADDRSRINDDCMEYMEFHNESGENKSSFIMLRDSYSIMLFDWLAESCDSSYYKPLWDFGFDINEIISLDVDYVIYFITDMNLNNIIK